MYVSVGGDSTPPTLSADGMDGAGRGAGAGAGGHARGAADVEVVDDDDVEVPEGNRICAMCTDEELNVVAVATIVRAAGHSCGCVLYDQPVVNVTVGARRTAPSSAST